MGNYISVYVGEDLIPISYTNYKFHVEKDSWWAIFESMLTLDVEAIVWTMKQGYIDDSTMEAKYVSTCEVEK